MTNHKLKKQLQSAQKGDERSSDALEKYREQRRTYDADRPVHKAKDGAYQQRTLGRAYRA